MHGIERDRVKEEARAALPRWLMEHGIEAVPGRPFRCLSPDHEDRHPSCCITPDLQHVKCFSCGYTADTLDLIQEERGCDLNAALDYAVEWLGIDVSKPFTYGWDEPAMPAAPAPGGYDKEASLADEIARAREAFTPDCPAARYLERRGISYEVARDAGLGYMPSCYNQTLKAGMAALIIPTGPSSYSARNLDPEAGKRERYVHKGKTCLFGSTEGTGPLWVCEGELDALSAIQAGHRAVGLGSASNTRLAVDALGETERPVLLLMDSDAEGDEATRKLLRGIKTATDARAHVLGSKVKDANEALVANRQAFSFLLARAEGRSTKQEGAVCKMGSYIASKMQADVERRIKSDGRKWGIGTMDAALGNIRNGLYVIAAESGAGKTTLVHQVCDGLAADGVPVLYVSLEQSMLELVGKSVARELGRRDRGSVVTAAQVMEGRADKAVKRALMDYATGAGENLSVIQGRPEGTRIDELETDVTHWAMSLPEGHKSPVVAIDYLQLVGGSDPRASDKQAADEVVHRLKTMSRDLDVAVLAISSLNRSSYGADPGMASLKESGGIEYTADVVLGLGCSVMGKDAYANEANVFRRRKMLADAECETPRSMTLTVLKNRYGQRGRRAALSYWPALDLFDAPEGEPDDEPSSRPLLPVR